MKRRLRLEQLERREVLSATFQEHFVEKLSPTGKGIEIGFGHGLYLAEILGRHPESSAEGYDISADSHRFLYGGFFDQAVF